MMSEYVVIRDMSAGNAETGDAWQETKIFSWDTPISEVMKWAMGDDHTNGSYSRKRITITRPHE